MMRTRASAARILPVLFLGVSLPAWAGRTTERPEASLSRRDAMRLALKNNLSKLLAEVNEDVAAAAEQAAEGLFDWSTALAFSDSRLDGFTGSADTTTWSRGITGGVTRVFETTGGALASSLVPVYKNTLTLPLSGKSSATALPYTGIFNLTYTQPLLRNFGHDVVAQALDTARINVDASTLQERVAVISLASVTETLYWSYAFAVAEWQKRQEFLNWQMGAFSRDLADLIIKQEGRKDLPIEDPTQSIKASLSQAQLDLLTSKSAMIQARNNLLIMILPNPEDWPKEEVPQLSETDLPDLGKELEHLKTFPTVLKEGLQAIGSEAPVPDDPTQVLVTSVEWAKSHRLEIPLADSGVQAANVTTLAAESLLKPQLDLAGGYLGNGGPRATAHETWMDLSDVTFPGYSVSLIFSIPIGNHVARGNLSKARSLGYAAMLIRKDTEYKVCTSVAQALDNLRLAVATHKIAKIALDDSEQAYKTGYANFRNGVEPSAQAVRTELSNWSVQEKNFTQIKINLAFAYTAYLTAVGAYEERWALR